jgi:predicted secreted protein
MEPADAGSARSRGHDARAARAPRRGLNKGYQAYALTYRLCTASAQEASARYLREGEQLARSITGRYGG